jgi:XapX domain-containing protein
MKIYLASLGAGLLVGTVYSLVDVRSPAPPLVALVGLLGILLGEQIVPLAKHIIAGRSIREAVRLADCQTHLLGELPANNAHGPGKARATGV